MSATRGADGLVVISYPGRIRRFRGGTVTRHEGRVIHTFTEPTGTFRPRRPWRLWTRSVDYLVIGGGGGGANKPGKAGDSLSGRTTPCGPFTVTVGRGGAPGTATRPAGGGGASRFTEEEETP